MSRLLQRALALAVIGVCMTVRTTALHAMSGPAQAGSPTAPVIAMASPTVTPAEVDHLIDQLGDDDFDTREAAQNELLNDAKKSRENALLIRDRLRAHGLTSADLDVISTSKTLLSEIHMLGAFTITIDDGTEDVDATSDAEETSIHIDHDLVHGEIVAIKDPFFDQFVLPKSSIFFLEAVNATDPDFPLISDILSLYAFEGHGLGGFSEDGMGLLFLSDDGDNLGHVSCTDPLTTCVDETGEPQEMAATLLGPDAGFLSIQVTSDVETFGAAPEPASLLLSGTGLVALLGVAMRRRRFAHSGDPTRFRERPFPDS